MARHGLCHFSTEYIEYSIRMVHALRGYVFRFCDCTDSFKGCKMPRNLVPLVMKSK